MSRVVLVSGAGSGIGEATARRFAAAGDRVVVTDIDLDAATAVARDIGDSAHPVALDASDADQWQRAVTEAERFADGPVQVLVNNAGILRNVSIEDIDLDLWRRILDVNLTGTLLGMRAVLPGMRSAGGGVIVNTGSTAGLAGYVGLSAYSSTKWALRGLTRGAALEFARDNIRVNLVVPGVVETPASRAAGYPTYLPGQPIPQVAQPADIANVTFYLASPEASYVTGAEYVADGGRTVGLLK